MNKFYFLLIIFCFVFTGCSDAVGSGANRIDGSSATVVYRVESILLDIENCPSVTTGSSDIPEDATVWGRGLYRLQYGLVDNLLYPVCEYGNSTQLMEEVVDPDNPDMMITQPVDPPMWRHDYTVNTSSGWSQVQEVEAGNTVRLRVEGAGIIYDASILIDGETCAHANNINGRFDFTCEIFN